MKFILLNPHNNQENAIKLLTNNSGTKNSCQNYNNADYCYKVR